MDRRGFHVADYVVFGATIAISLGIGLFFAFKSRKQKTDTVSEYLVGDRKMKIIPVAISLFVSFLSTIGIMGHPAEVYAYGTQFMFYLIAVIAGLMFGTFVFVPLLYPLKITSVFEYHEMRFRTKYIQVLVIGLAMLIMLLLNGILIFSPCVAFQAVSGFPAWASIIISGLVGVAYTTLGGMKAVVWTDVFQAFIIFLGLIILLVKGTIEAGGVSEVWRINEEWGRITFFDFRFDPTIRVTFWSVVVFNSLLWMAMTTAQPSVQRFMTLPTLRQAKISVVFIVPGFITSGLLTCIAGVTAFAYYARRGCDPLSAGYIRGPNEIIALFVMDVLDIPSLPGMFIACLFSASLSSVSSTYNGMAAIIWESILKGRLGHLSPGKQANVTKIITLVVGLLSIGTGFLLMELGGTLIQITYSVVGAVGGPLLGVNIVAGFLPKVGPRGIFAGTIISTAFCLWMSLGATLTKVYTPPIPGPTYNCTMRPIPPMTENQLNFSSGFGSDNFTTTLNDMKVDPVPVEKTGLQWMYSISYFYYPGIGILIVLLVSVLFMVIPGLEVPQHTPKHLLFPCVRSCCGEESSSISDTKEQELEILNPDSKGDKPNGTVADGDEEEVVWVLRDDVKLGQLSKAREVDTSNVYSGV